MARRNLTIFAALLIAIGLLGLVIYRVPLVWMSSTPASAQSAPPATLPGISAGSSAGILAGMETTLEGIYAQVSPSVVAIQTVRKQAVQFPPIPDIPGFPSFGSPFQSPKREYRYAKALGSGFVWDRQGDIITNDHVVAGADRISVTFSDGTAAAGKVVGADPSSDLAVIRVEVQPDRLRPVQLVDSTELKVGQMAIAIGNPFGEQNTMTTGIVSGLGRSLPVSSGTPQGPTYTIPDVIQTDAPINPGNSGGVLLDDQGRVIGVTSAIASPVQASAGIGFAIPSAIVQKVVPVLIKIGHYEHPWLGISGISLNPDLAKAMGLKPDQRGALVEDLTRGGPADRAGLRGSDHDVTIDGLQARIGGDVIVAINNQPINGFDDLVAYLARDTAVGQTITLTVLRQGKQETVRAALAARPARNAQ